MPRTARTQKQAPQNRRKGILFAVLVPLVLLILGGAILVIATHSAQQPSTAFVPKKQNEQQLSATALMDGSVTNIALFFVDSDNDLFIGRAETVLLLTVDNPHGKLKLTSVEPNEALSVSYEQDGAEEAVSLLSETFALSIQEYLTVNFAQLSAIIDALGGVNATLTGDEIRALNNELYRTSIAVSTQATEDIANGEAHTYPVITDEDYIKDIAGGLDLENGAYEDGRYHLNGNQSAAYGRLTLASDTDGGAKRQQTVVTELLSRITEIGTNDYTKLLGSLLPHCKTSLTEDTLSQLTPILQTDFTIEAISVPLLTDEDDTTTEDYDLTSAQRIDSFLYEDASLYWEEFGNTGKRVGNQ